MRSRSFGRFTIIAFFALCAVALAAAQAKQKTASSNGGAARLFKENCATCHGSNGRGAVRLRNLPNFTDPEFHKSRSDARLIASITNGRGMMTPFKGELRPDEIRRLARYVRSFASKSASSTKSSPGEGLLERALKGQAQIIDLTHRLNAKAPTYDGSRDGFRYEKLYDLDHDGYALGAFRVPEHFATHVDAPAHFIKGKETIDQIEAKRFIAPAAVIDVRSKVENNADYQLTVADIQAWERDGAIPDGAAVLLLTGWDSRYDDASRYRNADAAGVLHFPGFSEEAIKYLLKNRKIVALGIDTLSIDYGPSKDFAGHKLSLAEGLYHIENLTGLDKLPARGAVIFVAPLPIEGGSGSPARVLAIAP